MAHEKEKAQYDKDRNDYERPWELWEYRPKFGGHGWSSLFKPPGWDPDYEYRRKEPVFEPEYFSGLNWREALPLVGKVVEFSGTPDMGWKKAVLESVVEKPVYHFIQNDNYGWLFVRTCPETHQHPTITIGGVELPRPEVEPPSDETSIFVFSTEESDLVWKDTWYNNLTDREWLAAGLIHLTESRAQAWADWWNDTVIKTINETNI